MPRTCTINCLKRNVLLRRNERLVKTSSAHRGSFPVVAGDAGFSNVEKKLRRIARRQRWHRLRSLGTGHSGRSAIRVTFQKADIRFIAADSVVTGKMVSVIVPCCETMQPQLDWSCADHGSAPECPDALVGRFGTDRRYGLYIHDGGSSYLEIHFCPWCGTRLSE